ncbi:hypothetical protein DFH28DRAFT_889168 [Melampsora americana]|nr:hypothetical protein DFH28DRAFT_889168 [Melampsora americana]
MSDYKPTPYSPNRYSQSASNQSKRRNHPCIISGIFDILVKVESDSNNQYGTRTYQTAISTLTPQTSNIVEWVINAVGYVGPETQLEAAHSYYLKGRLLALNTTATQNFYFETEHHVLVNTSDALPGGLANTISVTGVGLIISRSVENLSPGKDNVSIVVKHSDYNPSTRSQESFEVQYCCNWSKLMEKLQPLLVPSREAVITGNITGWNSSTHTWIVDITGVNIMSGPENNPSSSAAMPIPSITTPGGRSRGKIAFTGAAAELPESSPEAHESLPEDISASPAGKSKVTASPKGKRVTASALAQIPDTSPSKGKIRSLPKSPTNRSPTKRSKVVHGETKGRADQAETDPI